MLGRSVRIIGNVISTQNGTKQITNTRLSIKIYIYIYIYIYIKYKKGKKKEKKIVNYAPKWRKTPKNNLLIPAAAVASRPSLSPPLITDLLPLPEPRELLRLNPL